MGAGMGVRARLQRRADDDTVHAAAGATGRAAAAFQASPRGRAQRAVIAQLFGAGSLQRKVSMKDGGAARRTTGSGPALRREVQDTIDGGDLTDMEATENQLHTSITNRETDLYARKDKGSDTYQSHLARIELEKELRGLLRQAIRAIKPAPVPAKKAPPKPKGPGGGGATANPFALLGEM